MLFEDFKKLNSGDKIKHLMGVLATGFDCDSVVYDLNGMLAYYVGYEAFVWNAAMLLVERGQLGVIQMKFGNQIRWIMTHPSQGEILSNDKFHCPLAKV